MGGGKSSSKQSSDTVTYDQDQIADNGSISLGEGNSLEQMTGGAVGVADNVITGQGNSVNHGIMFGEGASYSVTGLDDRSYQLIDTAMTLQHLNTENFMELTAEREGIDSAKITPLNPQPGRSVAGDPLTLSNQWFAGIIFVGIVTLIILIKGKKKR